MSKVIEHPWNVFGGPAFPSESAELHFKGMTLRDYFAAKALQGLLTEYANPSYGTDREPYRHGHDEFLAKSAYGLADAMLAERDKP